jgi:hypothetical protein
MSLAAKAERWVKAGIIDEKTVTRIFEFEAQLRAKRVAMLATLFGLPVVIIGGVLAFSVAYANLGDSMGFALDLAATSLLAVGTFHVVVKKLAYRSKGLALSMLNFAIGAALLIAAIEVENLSPYRSLLIWASLILFSTLLARRFFKWLVGITLVYMTALWVVRQIFGDTIDPYIGVAFLLATLTPMVLFVVWLWSTFRKTWAWFWRLQIIKALLAFLKHEWENIKEWWYRVRIRGRATSIWLGRHRRFILEVVGGALIGCMLRKHFEFIDALLWESQSIYTFSTFAIWGLLLSLIPKERYVFSMWFSFIGSLEIFLHFAQFGAKEGFRLGPEGTHYHVGHLSLGIIFLIGLSAVARRLVKDKWKASQLFQLGPLGWMTAAGLISLI